MALLQGQQLPPLPIPQTATGDDQTPPAPAPAPDTVQPLTPAPDTTPAPVPIDPKTKLPLTPAEIREQEIDKFDPMKRSVDPTSQPKADPLTDREQPAANRTPSASDSTAEPLPGSLAAQTAALAEDQPGTKTAKNLAPDASADSSDTNGGDAYSGPAVLSRSYTLARPMIPHQIKWAAVVGASYSWNDGETPSAVNGKTTYLSTTSEGHSLNWSVNGRHIWKHDQIGLSYAGSGSQFGESSLSGWNHSLNLDYGHVISRRLTVQFVESVQDLSQNYSLENPVLTPAGSLANINLATSPSVQLLNSTTRSASSQASLTYHQSSRLSYNMSSSYFLTGRSQGIGMRGQQASGDVNYRWSRRVTVGAYYSFTDYQYSHNVSTSDSHGIGAIYSYALNGSTQLQTRIGASRIESLAYEAVPLPPLLAAILGQGSTIINAYNRQWTTDISVQLVRDFRRSRTASLSYAHGESPGNGILLTSVQQSISAGYSVSLFRRRFPISGGVVYSSLSSASQGNLGSNTSETAYLGTSRPLGHGLNSTFSFNYAQYKVSGTPYQAHNIGVSVGFSWGLPANLLRF